jgi:hypothetical protein
MTIRRHPFVTIIFWCIIKQEDINDDVNFEDNNRKTYTEKAVIKGRSLAFAALINP